MKKFKAIIFFSCLLPLAAMAQLNVRIDNVYSREMPPTASNIAVYMTIRNFGSHGVSLESISSEIAESAMIHHSKIENGMMVMEHLSELYIPSLENVRLEPGGLHIMLADLRSPLRAGDLVWINLSFSNGVVLRVDVQILGN
ncbi:MAG: copper chaperone PCu(A)C [Pseudohongiellaceae bacterium]